MQTSPLPCIAVQYHVLQCYCSSLEEWVGDYEVDGWRLLGGAAAPRAPTTLLLLVGPPYYSPTGWHPRLTRVNTPSNASATHNYNIYKSRTWQWLVIIPPLILIFFIRPNCKVQLDFDPDSFALALISN